MRLKLIIASATIVLFSLNLSIACKGQGQADSALADSVVPPITAPVQNVGNSMPNGFRNTQNNHIVRAEKLDSFFSLIREKKRPVRIVHIGDSHVRGHVFSVVTRRRLEAAWGKEAVKPQDIDYKTTAIAQESGKAGLVYHAFGVNGALTQHFLTKERLDKVAELKPDLVIVSFGTNEAHVNNYDAQAHCLAIIKLTDSIMARCPETSILLTTPPGAFMSHKEPYTKKVKRKGKMVNKTFYNVSYKVNSNTPKAVLTIKNVADSYALPLWNLYEICGGQTSACNNWTGAGLMKDDHIHFKHEGYIVQGNLLAESILKAFNRYMEDLDLDLPATISFNDF
ncbi:MAG: GDSL-type esterase/lipase family protein [Paludibacteraceae bacterium]|nr:hypothetical protein [Candidatus Physcocola equi]MCQ2233873.1 GDSL-type esterase/lipase family protein [Paludibacteraceae bacterium]